MASNSLFSTVTPCQQNFFWGEYGRLASTCLLLGLGLLGRGSAGVGWEVRGGHTTGLGRVGGLEVLGSGGEVGGSS